MSYRLELTRDEVTSLRAIIDDWQNEGFCPCGEPFYVVSEDIDKKLELLQSNIEEYEKGLEE